MLQSSRRQWLTAASLGLLGTSASGWFPLLADELANEADLRLSPPKESLVSEAADQTRNGTLRDQADHRLPPPGSILTRVYKGEALQVLVRADGFEFDGDRLLCEKVFFDTATVMTQMLPGTS